MINYKIKEVTNKILNKLKKKTAEGNKEVSILRDNSRKRNTGNIEIEILEVKISICQI